MGGLEEKSAGNFLVFKECLTLQRFVLRLECVVPPQIQEDAGHEEMQAFRTG